MPNSVKQLNDAAALSVEVVPNPSKDNWKIVFSNTPPAQYSVKVYDLAGRKVLASENNEKIEAGKLAAGAYNIEVTVGEKVYHLKSVKD